MSKIKLPTPTLTGNANADIENLYNVVSVLRKELEFALQNIDYDNSPFMEGVIGNVVADVSGNQSSITQNADQIALNVAGIAGNQSSITQNADQIALNVAGIAGNASSITQNANNIALKVSTSDYNGNAIASLINQTSTTIDISASKINLTGVTTMNGLTTVNGTLSLGSSSTAGELIFRSGIGISAPNELEMDFSAAVANFDVLCLNVTGNIQKNGVNVATVNDLPVYAKFK